MDQRQKTDWENYAPGTVCSRCGYQNYAGAKICCGCGCELLYSEPVWDGSKEWEYREPQPRESNRPKKMWILAVCLVLGVLVLILSYFTVHFWTEGSCTKAPTCKICGKEQREAPGHQWIEATCTTAKICEVCDKEVGDPLGHQWQKATCTESAVCLECGETEGAATGHSWLPATCTSASACEFCGEITGEKLEHSWLPATCTNASVCEFCGEETGEKLEHTWVPADCDTPETCSLCGMESVPALGHVWTAATFRSPQTCERCGDTQGTAIPYENISVSDEVLKIREMYNDIVAKRNAGDYSQIQIRKGVVGYYDHNGELKCLVVYRNTDGIGGYSDDYSRWYYYDQNQLFFAYYEGSDAHRLYFYDGMLMRWRYRPVGKESAESINYDFEFSDKYLELEKIALEEAYSCS